MFEAFPKMARLNRDIVITEKIDGTNAQIWIEQRSIIEPELETTYKDVPFQVASIEGIDFAVAAGSRTRWISPKDDNYGFGRWVWDNASELVKLGPGRHFGEWWGKGIQRNYSQPEKHFSLFNTARWLPHLLPAGARVVPVLYEGKFSQFEIQKALTRLVKEGSQAAPGFMDPEGIVVFHTAANAAFKVTIKDDEKPKGLVK